MGVGFLWIDSLCIIQNSTSDWQVESAKMAYVYKNEYCNIAGTAASDGTKGLFFPRTPSDFTAPRIGLQTEGISRIYEVFGNKVWSEGVDTAPLYKRAWALQERLLSTRNLHFGQKQIFWECCELSSCEQFPTGDIPTNDLEVPGRHLKRDFSQFQILDRPTPAQAFYLWRTVVM